MGSMQVFSFMRAFPISTSSAAHSLTRNPQRTTVSEKADNLGCV